MQGGNESGIKRSEGGRKEVVVAVYASGSWRWWYCWQCKRGDRKLVVGECDGDEDRWWEVMVERNRRKEVVVAAV